jgi:hypothetical protein
MDQNLPESAIGPCPHRKELGVGGVGTKARTYPLRLLEGPASTGSTSGATVKFSVGRM